MFLNAGSKLFGWLAGLALTPVPGWGQEFLVHPHNTTVCVGEAAVFTSETRDGFTGWFINDTRLQDLPPETERQIDIKSRNTPNGTTVEALIPGYNEAFNGLKVQSVLIKFGVSAINSTVAYLFYETSQQHPVTGLVATANDTAIQLGWEASRLTARYLVSISNVTETPVVVSSTHYVYPPESKDCKWYEFMVTADECFNATDQNTRQTTAAPIRLAYPNIGPVTFELSGQEVLVSWSSDNNSALQMNITDPENGNQRLVNYNGASPFHYTAVCGQFIKLDAMVSPAGCAWEPAFTHSANFSFSIHCPVTDQYPGTQVSYSSQLLAVAAVIPLLAITAVISLLRWQHRSSTLVITVVTTSLGV